MNQRIFNRKWILFLWGIVIPLSFAQANLQYSALFKDGDYIKYDIYWSFLKVGSAEIKFTEPKTNEHDKGLYKIEFTVQTNPIVSSIYPVENKIQSTLSVPELNPIEYNKSLNEQDEKSNTTLTFDWDKKLLQKTKNKTADSPIKLEAHTLDPLSLILSMCQYDFSKNTTLKQKVTDGGPIIEIEASHVSELQIKTPSGTFDTRKIEVSTEEIKGIFKKSPDARVALFLSKDVPAIPVKLKSEVIVGHFYANLTEGLYQGKPIKGTWTQPHSNKNFEDPQYSRPRLSPKFKGFKKR